jgi:hypothetical protein
MDLASGSDDQLVANDFETWSSSKTTTIYPNTSSGDNAYHLSVTATGNWSVTITEAP